MAATFISSAASTGNYTVPAGTDRQMVWFMTWEATPNTVPNGVTYGGQPMTPMFIEPILTNTLALFAFVLDEAGIQAAEAVGTAIVEDWPESPPAARRHAFTVQGVSQDSPYTTQFKFNDSFTLTPTSIAASDNSCVVEICGTGNGDEVFQWTDYTQSFSSTGAGWTHALAYQDIVTGGVVAEEFLITGGNARSFLATIVFQEPSIAPFITDFDTDDIISSDQVGITITGGNFEDLQGNGSVIFSPTVDPDDVNAVSVTTGITWSATSLSFDMDPAWDLKPGTIYAYVRADSVGTSAVTTISLLPGDGNKTQGIYGIISSGIYADTVGITEGDDVVEFNLTSTEGGAVNVLLSGLPEISYDPNPVPESDTFQFRIFDLDVYQWTAWETATVRAAITGSGDFQAVIGTFAGAGQLEWDGSGSFASDPSTFTGAGYLEWDGSGDFDAVLATFTGAGSITITGSGVAQAEPATGYGLSLEPNEGIAQAEPATGTGIGRRIINGTGSARAEDATNTQVIILKFGHGIESMSIGSVEKDVLIGTHENTVTIADNDKSILIIEA